MLRRECYYFARGSKPEFAVRADNLHILIMTAADFESLPDLEKREVLSNLLKISREISYPEASDEELVGAAEVVFLAYDALENHG